MLHTILRLLSDSNVLLVGKTDAGKTYFVQNSLIPFLQRKGKKVVYCENMEKISESPEDAIVILDEFEILEDREFLENRHPNERPYYTETYLKRVQEWLGKARNIRNPCIYLVTRNEPEEMEYLQQIKTFSFAGKVHVLELSGKREH